METKDILQNINYTINEILKHPSFLDELSDYQIDKITEAIREQLREERSLSFKVKNLNPKEEFEFPRIRELVSVLKIIQERGRNKINKAPQPEPEEVSADYKREKKMVIGGTKIEAKHYAATYVLDCYATGRGVISGKIPLEEVFEEYLAKVDTPKKNTCYKQVANYNLDPNKTYQKFDWNNSTQIANDLGDNWKEIVLELSLEKEALKAYLETKYNQEKQKGKK